MLKYLMGSFSCATCIYLRGILISYLLFTEPLFHGPQRSTPQCTSGLLIDWFRWIKGQLVFSPCENSRACLPAVTHWPPTNVNSRETKTCQNYKFYSVGIPLLVWIDLYCLRRGNDATPFVFLSRKIGSNDVRPLSFNMKCVTFCVAFFVQICLTKLETLLLSLEVLPSTHVDVEPK